MSVEKAIQQVLKDNQASFPEIEAFHLYDISKADETVFSSIIALKEDHADTGQNRNAAITRRVWVAVLKKIKDNTIEAVREELEVTGKAVAKKLRENTRLTSTLYPAGFAVSSSIIEVERGNTTTSRVDRARYYRVTLEVKYREES